MSRPLDARPANPFEACREDPPEQALTLPEPVRAALDAGSHIQIVGAAGMGKTTLLRAVEQHALRAGQAVARDRVDRDHVVPPAPERGWWLLDEAQFAPRRTLIIRLRQALAAGCRVTLATHRRLGWELRVVGGRWWTWRLRGLTSDQAVAELLAPYLERDGRRTGEVTFQPVALQRLRRVSSGNLEAVLRLCYEVFEDLGGVAIVTAEDIDRAARILRRDAPDVLNWRRLEHRHRR